MPFPGWYSNFVSSLIMSIPENLDEDTAKKWIENPEGLKKILNELSNPTIPGTLKNDKTNDGWELIKDVLEPTNFSVQELQINAFAEGTEDIIGDPMVNLILEMNGLLGQWQAEYALEHQGQLSDEFQRFSLVFPGTVWKSPDGNHQVPCLTYRQGQWDLIFGILEGGFDSRDVMASLD